MEAWKWALAPLDKAGGTMNDPSDITSDVMQRIDRGAKRAIAEAVEEHRRAGRSIAISRDGQVVILPPEAIPPLQPDPGGDAPTHA